MARTYTTVRSMRFKPSTFKALKRAALERGMTMSEIVEASLLHDIQLAEFEREYREAQSQ